jgi:hypothetical protein
MCMLVNRQEIFLINAFRKIHLIESLSSKLSIMNFSLKMQRKKKMIKKLPFDIYYYILVYSSNVTISSKEFVSDSKIEKL